MFVRLKKFVPGGMILVLFLLLTACSSAGSNSGSTQNQGAKYPATAPAITTPQLVTPKGASGSPGTGPQVISSPTIAPGGKPGSQQIVLSDRTLIITSVSEQNGVSPNTTLISLNLIIQNTSAKTIMNLADFFQLMGSEGDIFGSQYNSSDNFYGNIPAHTTRNGMIAFQIPTAATAGLRLLYRPEVATETTIILLKISQST